MQAHHAAWGALRNFWRSAEEILGGRIGVETERHVNGCGARCIGDIVAGNEGRAAARTVEGTPLSGQTIRQRWSAAKLAVQITQLDHTGAQAHHSPCDSARHHHNGPPPRARTVAAPKALAPQPPEAPLDPAQAEHAVEAGAGARMPAQPRARAARRYWPPAVAPPPTAAATGRRPLAAVSSNTLRSSFHMELAPARIPAPTTLAGSRRSHNRDHGGADAFQPSSR